MVDEATDAQVWTEEFLTVVPDADPGLMLGWFANAIEAGALREAARYEQAAWLDQEDGDLVRLRGGLACSQRGLRAPLQAGHGRQRVVRNLSEMVSGRGCSSVMDDDDEPDDTWPEIECPACAVVMTGEYTACPYCAADLRAGDALDRSYDIEQAARQVTESEES